jgi:hypothetical protein
MFRWLRRSTIVGRARSEINVIPWTFFSAFQLSINNSHKNIQSSTRKDLSYSRATSQKHFFPKISAFVGTYSKDALFSTCLQVNAVMMTLHHSRAAARCNDRSLVATKNRVRKHAGGDICQKCCRSSSQ